ncbi:HAD-IIIA family hydrolase [Streptomyces antimycoticus]|uniref:D-glycero-alpha-D-manno-heptose-1,7-bisphosphate 7-phosphatase n=1 Tax=Streptomyces antimycoticus TaxID=68175 RepID=UPI0030B809FB
MLFDRDGTLVENVPYNGDPRRVRPAAGARRALAELRARGVALGVVTNQSGVGRGLLERSQVQAVHERIAELLGPFDVWAVCPHAPWEGCLCRKPAPGLVLAAMARVSAAPDRTVVIGDAPTDVGSARAAGALGVLLPSPGVGILTAVRLLFQGG